MRRMRVTCRRRALARSATTLACALALAFGATARAEHAVPYRYTVLGYVKDGGGQQRPGVQVEVVREKTGFSYLGETDRSGFYVIVTRLGDESEGERLRLRAADMAATLVARFDPNDHTRERGTRVDLVGRKWVETPAAFAATLKQFLGQ